MINLKTYEEFDQLASPLISDYDFQVVLSVYISNPVADRGN